MINRIAVWASDQCGRPVAFVIACLLVLAWGLTGPLFGYSEGWQIVINTGATIVTFLMMFLLQNTAVRDVAAVQLKLDELIASSNARNEFIGAEKKTLEELAALKQF